MFAEGGCSCGQIRYGLKLRPMFVHACHCKECQRLTGAPYAMNAIIEKNAVALLAGTPALFALKGGSGQPLDVHFCTACGTYVWSEYHIFAGDVWFVRVGTLDDANLLAPDVHIYTRWKHVADILPEGVPCFDIYYDTKEQWPPESYDRLLAVMKAGARIPPGPAR